jgi:6-phospho-3-hexuloisomerase
VLQELQAVLQAVDVEQIEAAAALVAQSRAIFVAGAGRSGLALKMAAMRLMHLGLTVYVAGETTTPAIGKGDLLLVASASGTTASILQAAQVAHRSGASVLAITAAQQSPLHGSTTAVIYLPAAAKTDLGERKSQQYAGSLFEQAALLTLDILFHALWKIGPQTAEELLQRHANLE